MLSVMRSALCLLILVLPAFSQVRQSAPKTRSKPFTVAQVWALDATYIDREHGVSFRYPSTWHADTIFGYHPPALVQSNVKPIAGFGYEEGGFPRTNLGPYSSTNLEGFGIVYAAIPAKDAAVCEAIASSIAPADLRTVVLGGRVFAVRESVSAGMSQSVSGKLYTAFAQHTCYFFETDVNMVSDQVLLDNKGFTAAPEHSIESHLFVIMKSVRIEPRR